MLRRVLTPATLRQSNLRLLFRYLDRLRETMPQLSREEQLRERKRYPTKRPSLWEVEFRNYSQNGEDGILNLIFTLLGEGKKTTVEIGCGNGLECNSANLILNHGWTGLLLDASSDNVDTARRFFSDKPVVLDKAWITRENVNQTLGTYGYQGEIDLLSIDVDGVDFWIWEALHCVNPRVVVMEFNRGLGEKSWSVKYEANFSWQGDSQYDITYHGASLPALTSLGKKKGFRLIGVDSLGINAFFLRNDVGLDEFPTVSAEECLASFVGTSVDFPLQVDSQHWVSV